MSQLTVKEKCPTCGGSGGVDSGGFTPWGEWITSPCPDCTDGWARRELTKEEYKQFAVGSYKIVMMVDKHLVKKIGTEPLTPITLPDGGIAEVEE